MPTIEVRFASGACTDCVIEPGALEQLPALCTNAGLAGTTGLLCDARLLSLHGEAMHVLGAHFGEALPRPVAESTKTLAEVEAMCEALSTRGVGRDGYVVAVGGGVLTDLAGLAAALYLRGASSSRCARRSDCSRRSMQALAGRQERTCEREKTSSARSTSRVWSCATPCCSRPCRSASAGAVSRKW